MTAVLVTLLLALPLAAEAAAEYREMKAAVHVHTTFSTGALSVDELAQEARRLGIDALILTDNLRLRFEYGLFPLRGLLRRVVEKPSVLQAGVERYLRAVEEAQERFPEVVLVPGVEVAPYYYWTGSPWTRDLTMWDAQKNLLVVGLSRVEDYERIPAIGTGSARRLGATKSLELALAVLAMAAGGVLLRLRGTRSARFQHFTLRIPRRYRLPGFALLSVGVLLALEAVASPHVSPYRGNLGIQPYQGVIDWVGARGGMTFWSFPEARDFSAQPIGAVGTVTIRTEPHPDALVRSDRYTGFGAIYPDTVHFTEPGRQWDRLLADYAEGRRAEPAWGIGEVGYHEPPKPLDDAVTIALVRTRTREGILDALRAGRLYAVRTLPDYHLVLRDFSMSRETGTDSITMGGELAADERTPLRLTLRVVASDGRAVPFEARLIRSGAVAQVLHGDTPFETVLRVAPPPGGRREFFRLQITAPHPLLSNPIFVRSRR